MGHWRLIRVEFQGDPALNYALDAAIAQYVGEGLVPPTIRLWRPGRCLAVGRLDTRLPRFEGAVSRLKSQGIAVIRRLSGGKAVWQDESYLNFSVIAPRNMKVPEAYMRFSEGVRVGLRRLGIESTFGHVEGSFCDGPYDLAVGEKKLVGTAQVQKRGYIIVHGTILVDCDLAETIAKISEFYRLAGSPIRLRREAMTTLAEELRRPISQEELIEALMDGHQSALGKFREEEPSKDELELAERLEREHML